MLSLKNTIKLTCSLCPCNQATINYGSVVDLKISIHKWHSCMQQSPLCTLYLHAVFLKRLHTALPHQSSSMALAKRANGKWTVGAPAGFLAHVLFMSMGRRDAPRHTPCQKHTLPRAPESLTTFPFQTSSFPVKPRDIFTLCAPLPRSCLARKVIIVTASHNGKKHSSAM